MIRGQRGGSVAAGDFEQRFPHRMTSALVLGRRSRNDHLAHHHTRDVSGRYFGGMLYLSRNSAVRSE
jgi:hypothetical protein